MRFLITKISMEVQQYYRSPKKKSHEWGKTKRYITKTAVSSGSSTLWSKIWKENTLAFSSWCFINKFGLNSLKVNSCIIETASKIPHFPSWREKKNLHIIRKPKELHATTFNSCARHCESKLSYFSERTNLLIQHSTLMI